MIEKKLFLLVVLIANGTIPVLLSVHLIEGTWFHIVCFLQTTVSISLVFPLHALFMWNRKLFTFLLLLLSYPGKI